jgi:hypothetical protein
LARQPAIDTDGHIGRAAPLEISEQVISTPLPGQALHCRGVQRRPMSPHAGIDVATGEEQSFALLASRQDERRNRRFLVLGELPSPPRHANNLSHRSSDEPA